MAVAAVSLRVLPCPYCRQPVDEQQSVVRETVRHGVDCLELQCTGCGKSFTHYRQLARSVEVLPSAARAIAAASQPAKAAEKAPDALSWLLAGGIAFTVEFLARVGTPQNFLVIFAVLFLGAFTLGMGASLNKRLLGLCCFELTGLFRIHHALSTGHHNLSFLVLMMVVGGLVLLIESGGGSGSSSSGPGLGFGGGGYHSYYHSHCHSCSGCGGGWWSGGGSSGSSGSGGGGGGCGGCGS